MEYKQIPNVNIENAHLMFKNFAGRQTAYNRSGDRNFCVRLDDPEIVCILKNDGWNVRELPAREEGESPTYYIPVAVSFNEVPGIIPMRVWMHDGKTKTLLDADTIDCLDYAELQNVDLTIRPYQWEVNGKSGVKAYLKTMHVTVQEDVWAAKYAENEHPREEDEDLPF